MDTSTTTTVQEARSRIDEINERVVELLAERQAIVDELCETKADAGQPVRDPEREAELLDHVRTVADEAGLSPALAETLFRDILEHSVAAQRRRRASENDPNGTSNGRAEDARPSVASSTGHG
jgi:chorismate mutase